MTRIGYQIPNFTYPGIGPDRLFAEVARQAAAADRSGFDTVMVMDHFYQLPMLGDPAKYMLECYSLLAALSQHTNSARLGALVTGNTYRNPALLAKTITTLDIVSGGRAQLGIGAGWFELEHQSLGFEFGTFTDRFEKLEESLRIVIPMLRGEKVTFSGKHYSTTEAVNSPAAVSRIPIMIGGGGEKKTLRMVAQYADESNIAGGPITDLPRKLEVLAAHCERAGRDRSEITMTKMMNLCVAPTTEEAEADLRAMAAVKGWNDEVIGMLKGIMVFGDPDTVGERIVAALNTGIDGITINAAANGHVPGRVDLMGKVALKALAEAGK